MQRGDFIKIGRSIHRMAQTEIGWTAMQNAVADLAEEIAEVCASDPHFDHRAFMNACALEERQ